MALSCVTMSTPLLRKQQYHHSPTLRTQTSLSSPEKATFEHVEDIADILEDTLSLKHISETNSTWPKAGFLTLPLEIRLQIYDYIINDHPTSNCHLARNPTATGCSPQLGKGLPFYLVTGGGRSIPESFYSSSSDSRYETSASGTEPLAFSNQITSNTGISTPSSTKNHHPPLPRIHTLPTALLLTSSQIYHESRLVPFHTNNWIFINWFNSGLYSATTFTKSLFPYQRQNMRYLGLEICGVELVGRNGGCVNEWVEACRLWDMVWEVRLVIVGRIEGYGGMVEDGEGEGEDHQDLRNKTVEILGKKVYVERSVLDVKAKWIMKGLKRMKGLRRIEIWIQDKSCSDARKSRFSEELKLVLGGAEVRVEGLGSAEKEVVDGGEDEDGEDFGNLNPFAQIYPGVWGGI